MFGNNNGSAPAPGGNRPAASSVARIENNLTHVLVSGNGGPDNVSVFINAQPVLHGALESVSVNIVAPQSDSDKGTLTGVVSRYQGGADGAQRTQGSTSLFPGTVEIIAKNRRIVITCTQDGQFDGLWLGVGMNADGTSTQLEGVRSLRVTVTPDLVDARLGWLDRDDDEDLLA